MPAIEPLPRNNPVSSRSQAVRRSKGTGWACSFTPLPYSRPYEIDVISVKKLLFFTRLPILAGDRLSFHGVENGAFPVGGTKIAPLKFYRWRACQIEMKCG